MTTPIDKRTHTYKYKTTKTSWAQTGIINFTCRGEDDYLMLSPDGVMRISCGYRHDGPSGPTWDTPNSLRAARFHDAFYQLLRERDLPLSYRKQIDELLRTMLIEDGMSRFRARYWYWAVRMFGGRSMPKGAK